MLALNDSCDKVMGTILMICDGQTFPVVENLATKSKEGNDGGLEPNIQNIVTAQPKNVTNPSSMINKRCTVNGIPYRVHSVDVGTIAIHFTLIDVNSRR